MKSVQTIDIGNLDVMQPQQGSHAEQPYRFSPEIISREIMDPGIDQQNVGDIADGHIITIFQSSSSEGKYTIEVFFSSLRLKSRM